MRTKSIEKFAFSAHFLIKGHCAQPNYDVLMSEVE